MRGFLILFAFLTSAELVTQAPLMLDLKPWLGLAVALIAAYESWLKPGPKYRAYYMANDEYAKLRIHTETIAPTDVTDAEAATEEYGKINERLAKSVTPD
jgi:hypothetical protein